MTVISVFSYGHLSDFFKSDFLFHIHFSVVICDFLVISSQITIVPMHVPFRIHYRNYLIDKKDSYPIPRPPSWDDRNCSYGHQLYPCDYAIDKRLYFELLVELRHKDTWVYYYFVYRYYKTFVMFSFFFFLPMIPSLTLYKLKLNQQILEDQ